MKIRGLASRRLRCMRVVVERLCKALVQDVEATAALRFCGMAAPPSPDKKKTQSGPLANIQDLPLDFEVLVSGLADFVKVFKLHWEEVNDKLQEYERFFA